HGIAACHQHPRAFGAGRAGTHDQYGVVGAAFRKFLRMPAAPIFLAGGGVLRADHRRAADLPARNADVAADADADVVVAALFDLLRQPRIGNGRPRRADDIGDALGHDLRHFFRVSEAPHAEHRLFGHLLDEARPWHLVTLLVEA